MSDLNAAFEAAVANSKNLLRHGGPCQVGRLGKAQGHRSRCRQAAVHRPDYRAEL